MTRSCASPLGTVRPALAPSWLSAEPRMTPQMRSPSASASASRLSTMMPQPSPRTYPSAATSKVLHWPSGASIPALPRSSLSRPERMMCTPPASARSASRRCSPTTAWCVATSEDEQAVSTAIAGPFSPSANATRPMAVLNDVPLTE